MARLIDADILLDEICRDQCKHKYEDCDSACEIAAYVVNAPTVGGWISVKDRLPEKSGDYIAYTKDGLVWPYFFQDDTWYDGLGYRTETVTHWRPMPEPPEEVSGNG